MMDNPYEPPRGESSLPESSDSLSLGRAILSGAMCSVVAAFPLTVLMVSFFRFPVPFVGYVTGPSNILSALFALLFYGIVFGGFLLLAIAGGMAGAAARIAGSTQARQRLILRILAVGASGALLLVLATLDWVIGPW